MEMFYRAFWYILSTTLFVLSFTKIPEAYPDIYASETWFGLATCIVLVPSFIVLIVKVADLLMDAGSWKNGAWTSFNLALVGISLYAFIHSGADYGNCVVLAFLLAFLLASTLGVLWNDRLHDRLYAVTYRVMFGPEAERGFTYPSRLTEEVTR